MKKVIIFVLLVSLMLILSCKSYNPSGLIDYAPYRDSTYNSLEEFSDTSNEEVKMLTPTVSAHSVIIMENLEFSDHLVKRIIFREGYNKKGEKNGNNGAIIMWVENSQIELAEDYDNYYNIKCGVFFESDGYTKDLIMGDGYSLVDEKQNIYTKRDETLSQTIYVCLINENVYMIFELYNTSLDSSFVESNLKEICQDLKDIIG